MNIVRTLSRVLVPLSLVALAACQTVPTKKTASAPVADTVSSQPQQTSQGAPTQTPAPAQAQGANVAVFIADTKAQTGWTPVDIQSGMLYVNPQPVITRGDLTGIQAGANKEGQGLLALQLNESGKAKISEATRKNPNKRLALVVGRTMLAAPSYTTAVSSDHLVFAVGSEENATAAARAIAGVPQDGSGDAPAAPSGNAAPTTSHGLGGQ